jgi:hypothetical protein
MNNCQTAFRVSLFAAMTVIFVSFANAQATRTWVSGVGDDINPCSRVAPCKTFAGAISKTAAGGEINVLDAGGFGTVTVTKSITIDGSGAMASIMGSGTTAIVINIPATSNDARTVRIRGLAINGAGTGLTGIKVVSASKVTIENSVLDGFTADGVAVAGTGAQVFVKNTTIRNNAGAGISVGVGGSQVAISDVSLLYNGSALTTAAGGTIVSFKNNVLFGNKKDGDAAAVGVLR